MVWAERMMTVKIMMMRALVTMGLALMDRKDGGSDGTRMVTIDKVGLG